MLRPGNAGANTAADHIKMLDAALAQLPSEWQAGHRPGDDPSAVVNPILVRADSAGATHGFVDALVERNIGYSIGFDVDGRVRDALMLAQEEDWVPAVEGDGSPRPGAWVIELTDLVDVATWPAGTRLICRRERPHPGAQLSLFDIGTGFRHTCFLTDSPGEPPPLELRQRRHARVEDRIRGAKACGLRNFPFEDFVRNEAWLVLVMVAEDLLAWTAPVCLDGRWPKPSRRRCATSCSTWLPAWPVGTGTCIYASTPPGRAQPARRRLQPPAHRSLLSDDRGHAPAQNASPRRTNRRPTPTLGPSRAGTGRHPS